MLSNTVQSILSDIGGLSQVVTKYSKSNCLLATHLIEVMPEDVKDLGVSVVIFGHNLPFSGLNRVNCSTKFCGR